MSVRTTIQIGDPRLKAKNIVVKDFSNPEIKRVIKDLKDTMRKKNLVGMAAPQIAKNYKIFVTEIRKTKARSEAQLDDFCVFINPKITHFSENENIIYEGCGSVLSGQLFGPVKRPSEIVIEAFNINGEKFRLLCNGLLARVIQHEYDHLFGVEFTEKILDYKKLMSLEHYINFMKEKKNQNSKLFEITKKEYF
ncbi:MAG: peptide deformylase [bacterium]